MPYFDFEIGFFHHIRNVEYYMFYHNTVNQLEEANFEEPMMRKNIEHIKQHVELLKEAVTYDQKHETSDDINDLHKRRRGMLQSLRDIVDVSHNRETEQQRLAAKYLSYMISDLRNDIRGRNVGDEEYAAYALRNRAANEDRFINALRVLSLDGLFDTMLDVHGRITAMELTRLVDKTNRPNTKERRRNSYIELKIVLEMLNSLIMTGEEDGERATKLSQKLIEDIISVRRLFRFHKSINKNRKEREERQLAEEQDGVQADKEEDELDEVAVDEEIGNNDEEVGAELPNEQDGVQADKDGDKLDDDEPDSDVNNESDE